MSRVSYLVFVLISFSLCFGSCWILDVLVESKTVKSKSVPPSSFIRKESRRRFRGIEFSSFTQTESILPFTKNSLKTSNRF